MRYRRTTLTVSLSSAALVAVIGLGSQLLANAGPQPATVPRPAPAAAATTTSPDDDCDEGTAPTECGNEHSMAVRAWVACKAAKGKDACAKPTPPGRALGHAKHQGSGPASADGDGHGWGRAHAPGQLKPKGKPSAGRGEDYSAD
jgi:hypothetical protein